MTGSPNILIIYPDQMRHDSMSPSGNRIVKTPNLQRLSDEGMTFNGAFASYPLCCPFRASLMTGKQAQGHGLYQNHFPLRGDQEFLAERLKEGGYQTLYVGKWHLEGGPKPGFVPPDRRFGFDRFAGFNRGHNYMNGIFWRDSEQPFRCRRYEPDFQTDHMIEFIDEALHRTRRSRSSESSPTDLRTTPTTCLNIGAGCMIRTKSFCLPGCSVRRSSCEFSARDSKLIAEATSRPH